jgi:hypothetical protein
MKVAGSKKLFIALFLPLATAYAGAGSPDKDAKDALVLKYKNKIVVVAKEGLTTCLRREKLEQMRDGMPEGAGQMINRDGNAANFRSINCQAEPLHKGEVLKISRAQFVRGYLFLELTTVAPHTATRGIGAFQHDELERGIVGVLIMPDKVDAKEPGNGSKDDLKKVDALVAQWLSLNPADLPKQLGNTASVAFVHEVKTGMSFEEVESGLGLPQTRVDLGEKILYKYKDMTVEFHDGKVVDVR